MNQNSTNAALAVLRAAVAWERAVLNATDLKKVPGEDDEPQFSPRDKLIGAAQAYQEAILSEFRPGRLRGVPTQGQASYSSWLSFLEPSGARSSRAPTTPPQQQQLTLKLRGR